MHRIIPVALLTAIAISVVAKAASAKYTCPRGTDLINGECVER